MKSNRKNRIAWLCLNWLCLKGIMKLEAKKFPNNLYNSPILRGIIKSAEELDILPDERAEFIGAVVLVGFDKEDSRDKDQK